MLTLILGGARSGKSRLAQRLAAKAQRVSYVATCQAGQDSEMLARIERHRADRPGGWRTVEAPLALAETVERLASESDAVLVDCLTIWLSNLSWDLREVDGADAADCHAAVRGQLQRIAAAAGPCHIILVSNELGCGTVPESAVTRAFRDTHGWMNQWAAEAADEVILTVAGLPLYLKTAVRSEDPR